MVHGQMVDLASENWSKELKAVAVNSWWIAQLPLPSDFLAFDALFELEAEAGAKHLNANSMLRLWIAANFDNPSCIKAWTAATSSQRSFSACSRGAALEPLRCWTQASESIGDALSSMGEMLTQQTGVVSSKRIKRKFKCSGHTDSLVEAAWRIILSQEHIAVDTPQTLTEFDFNIKVILGWLENFPLEDMANQKIAWKFAMSMSSRMPPASIKAMRWGEMLRLMEDTSKVQAIHPESTWELIESTFGVNPLLIEWCSNLGEVNASQWSHFENCSVRLLEVALEMVAGGCTSISCKKLCENLEQGLLG